MPVINFQLGAGLYTNAQLERLMTQTSRLYAQVLESPIERVRVFIQLNPPSLAAVAGVSVTAGATSAPYFHFLVLEGRPLEQRQRLLSGFTDLLVDILGVERALVRGGCWPISPENWAIGGVPASVARAAEVRSRSEAAPAA